MYQKLFQITIVLFLVVFSIVAAAMIVLGVLSVSGPMMAHDDGIVVVAGGVNDKQIAYMIVAASLFIAGLYLFIRRSRFRR